MRLLVTDGDYGHTLGIVRALGTRHEVAVCATRRLSMAGVSRWTRRNLRCPPVADEPRFMAWLRATVERHRIDQVIPVSAAACRLLAARRSELPGVAIVLPSAEQMELALDKRRVADLATRLDIATPRTAEPSGEADLAEAARAVGFPLVIKAPIEGSADVAYVERAADLEAAYRSFVARNRHRMAGAPILQARLTGPGFGVFATYQDGRARRLMAHRRVREYPPSGGASSSAELVHDEALLELGQRVLDGLGWHGVAMVEFKRSDADGPFHLLEVNPKFWGSLDLALIAGCDFPGDLVRIAAGEQLPFVPAPTGSLRVSWPLSGELRHVVARPASLPAVLRDLVGRDRRTNLRWSDPLPHAVELAATAGAILRRR